MNARRTDPSLSVARFEGAKRLARIERQPVDDRYQPGRERWLVVLRGKLPNGSQYSRGTEVRDSWSEARALVRKRTGL